MPNDVRVISTSATASGSTTAGALSVGFKVGSGSHLINGTPISGSDAINFPALPDSTYPAITYTVTSGTLYIIEVLP